MIHAPRGLNQGDGPAQTAAIAVNRDRVVGVSWYDRRDDYRGYRDSFACPHIAAAADGRFHLLWTDSREGIYQLRSAVVQAVRR